MDFNVCETDCPLTCGRPIPFFCFVHCVRGCACPPGFVIDRRSIRKGCVSAKICPPYVPETLKLPAVCLHLRAEASVRGIFCRCRDKDEDSEMNWRLIAFAVICMVVIVAARRRSRGPVKCSNTEIAVRRWRRRDRFCRPMLTRPSLRWRRRKCICKPGYVRNAWNQCVPQERV
ncbi:hypothetical protein MTO96_026007 [Rhipicephalus appendiculatus]